MKIKKINELVLKRNQLTQKEKQKLAKGILNNKKARTIAINGAIAMNNFELAINLINLKTK